jgi:hypothetical protein
LNDLKLNNSANAIIELHIPTWFLRPITGSERMQRINTAYFYKLAQQLLPIKTLTPNANLYFEGYSIIHTAQEGLRYFLHNPLIPPMTSYSTGKELLTALEKITSENYDPDRVIQWSEPHELTEILGRFEISMQSDFGTRDTFIVSPKRAYSTTLLAEQGETLASEQALSLVPAMGKDLHDAGRCMAFELSTAAAFHLFRAVEAMVSEYGTFVRNKPFTQVEKKKGLGGMANLLKEKSLGVDTRITSTIEQVALLHRNPTMHPEMHISTTEINATLGIVVSVIETVAIDWNRRKTTPNIPLTDLLPNDSAVFALTEGDSDDEQGKIRPDNASNLNRLQDGTAKTA